ncbi:MAG: glycoside hydrolase family 3 C-terminal domain-containing protein, partial [Pseudomonadota bacterium]
ATAAEVLAAVDAACARVLRLKHRLGLFEDPYKGARAAGAPAAALTPATRALARQAAAASTVLLADRGVLPLGRGMRVALIGPLGDDRHNMLGTWAVAGVPEAAVTIREGLAAAGLAVTFAPGAPLVEDPAIVDRLNFVPGTVTPDPRPAAVLLAEAEAAAMAAEAVVVVLGEAKEHTGECASRLTLDVPAPQRAMLSAVRAAAGGKPVIAVVLAGRPLQIDPVVEAADAVFYAWFAGTEMGHGIADLLTGAAEPTGRLAISLPAHGAQAPIAHGLAEGGRPWPGRWQKFRTAYIDLDDAQHPARGRWPFGFGLSWSAFDVAAPRLDAPELDGPDAEAVARVAVTNRGDWAATAVVQCYVSDRVARIQRPAQELVGFERLSLAPGETREAVFRLTRAMLSYSLPAVDGTVARVWDPGRFVVRTGLNARDTRSATLVWRA